MTDLPPGLEEFATRLRHAAGADAARAPARRRRVLRRLAPPVMAALLAGAVGASAVGLLDPGQGPPIAPDEADTSRLKPPKDPGVVAASAVDDPGGGPPWVVRVSTDAAGRECAQVGRLRDGLFGQIQDGRFRELPSAAPGVCGPQDRPRTLAAVEIHAEPARTVVFGLSAIRRPLRISVGPHIAIIRPVGLGAYVAVFTGARRLPVTVDDGSGSPQHPQ
ncbi:MAG: hypothetical protein ACR2NB_11730 [Solirubrobacteraceae bacterium]